MRFLIGPLVLCVALVAVSCNAVYTPHPMGEEPLLLEHDEWEGTWMTAEGSGVIKVLDVEGGLLRLAWVEDSDKGLRFEKIDALLRSSGEFIFANVKDEETGLYTWVKVEKEGDQLVVWDPDLEKFRALVKEGKLPGKLDDKDVLLDGLGPEHVQMITSSSEGVLFDWENPSVLIRIVK